MSSKKTSSCRVAGNQLVVCMMWREEKKTSPLPPKSIKTRKRKNKKSPHTVEERVDCQACYKTFKNAAKEEKHKCSTHFRCHCGDCGKIFKRPFHASRHKSSCLDGGKIKCKKCRKVFTREDNMKRHMKKSCKK